jgi:hypothetical protein
MNACVQLAMKQMEAAALHMRPSFDIWQLGVFVYEAVKGPYWPENATEASILHKLATDSRPLPHEEYPADLGNVASMLKVWLLAVSAARVSASSCVCQCICDCISCWMPLCSACVAGTLISCFCIVTPCCDMHCALLSPR